MNEWCATKIAREWNVQQVGGRDVLKLWVAAEELVEFNAHIVGEIRQIARYDTVSD